MDTGDTAWMLMSTALVMVMLPGLALFYGGLVRRKNVLSTVMHSFFGLALVSIVWVIVGFTLAFGPDVNGMRADRRTSTSRCSTASARQPSAVYAVTIPFMLFAMFQLMFAAITPALITGAFAERKRFGSFVLFTILWSILIYSPIAHWVWSVDGWLFKLGALDFAGGTVVHISSGVSALVVALMIGKRHMNGDSKEPHDVPMVVLGAGLLWFGWFGFNAGSAVTAGGLAASAFTVTNIAAAAATITWVLASYANTRKVSVVGAACGAVAGLVAITPASGFVTPGGALIIGLVAGGLCYSATLLRARSRVDDALDVFAVHGVGGMFGAIATGIFASSTVQAAYSGLLDGNPQQLVTQAIAVGATVLYAAVGTVVIVKVVDVLLGIRVKPEVEEMGLDLVGPRRGRLSGVTSAAAPGLTSPLLPRRPLSTLFDGGRSVPLRSTAVNQHQRSGRTATAGRHAPLRRALRARRVRGRVRRGRRRAVARSGAAAGPRGAGGARASRGVRGGRGVERRRGGRAAAGSVACWSCWPGTRRPAGPASSRCSCRGVVRPRRGRGRFVEGVLAGEGLSIVTWRAVPVDPDALGSAAALSRPAFAQAIVARPSRSRRATPGPSRTTPSSGGSSSRDAGSRRPPARPAARWPRSPSRRRLRGPSSTRASSSAAGCPTCTRTCGRRCRVGYAVFHQRYATNTRPVWRLAQPFRSISHNGEINTVRGNREEVRGRAGDAADVRDRAGAPGRRPAPVRGRLRLALARRGPRAPDRDRLGPDRRAPDRDPRGAGACAARRIRTSPRCGAGRPGSWRRGTGRRPSSSPTGGPSARWSTGTGCGRRPSP